MQIKEVPCRSGKPNWMNLRAHQKERHGHHIELRGPGIYGLFLDGNLFYVGLYKGLNVEPFGGSVIDRWKMHVTYHTLRAPEITFAPGQLNKILELSGAPTEGIADCLPAGRSTDCTRLSPLDHPLVALHGASCTYSKVRFATRHWDTLGSIKGSDLLDRISLFYQRIPDEQNVLLAGATARQQGDWVKEQWLRPVETELIREFLPICNQRRADERLGVRVEDLEAAVDRLLARPLEPFARNAAVQDDPTDVSAPSSVAEPCDEESVEVDNMSIGEAGFRRRLSASGHVFVDAFLVGGAPGFQPYFTDNQDLRLRIGTLRSPLLTLSPAHGQLRCQTRASVEACQAIGFLAEPSSPGTGPMKASFYFDPGMTRPEALFAVAGAASA
jgi:hypothetical protein